MKFMISWVIRGGHHVEAVNKFLNTDDQLPEGVRRLGRWHGTGRGFTLLECDTPTGVYETVAPWADLLEYEVHPVVEDSEATEVLKKLAARA